jgi:AcrR family transcriptional regulator
MPKKPDAKLENRILNAAYNLWVERGEQGLTMRAVAKAAQTTTPTLYERFRGKGDLLAALRARAQQNLFDAIKPARSIAEACRLALEFTLAHGHEYELIAKEWAARLSRREATPSFDLIKERLAEQLGGSANDHLQLGLALVALYHGASILLLNEGIDPKIAADIRQACVSATDALVQNAARTAESRTAPAN